MQLEEVETTFVQSGSSKKYGMDQNFREGKGLGMMKENCGQPNNQAIEQNQRIIHPRYSTYFNIIQRIILLKA